MDVISVGRISVDLHANEPHAGFDGYQTFSKSVGGSPTNVAIAVARLGHRVGIVTKVGDDDFGRYAINRLAEWGVETTYAGVEPNSQTPLAITALAPPESPQVVFYRGSAAPDTHVTTSDVPAEVIREARILWISQASLAQGTTADACLDWMGMRTRAQDTILDLDYRPSLWATETAARSMAERAISQASIVVGNRDECAVAVGTRDPDGAITALLDAGVRLAIVKMGADGAMWGTAEARVHLPTHPIDIVSGLGAGDAFGGALCHGLLSGWDIERIGRAANAAGALVSSRLMCSDAMPDRSELSELLGGSI